MSSAPAPFTSIPEALTAWAAETPRAIALLAPGRDPLTYGELHQAVERLAAALRARGLARDDGIALLIPDGLELCLALLAAISVGIAVPLPWPRPEAEYRRVLDSQHVRAILVSAEFPAAALPPSARQHPIIALAPGPSGRLVDLRIDGPPVGRAVSATAPHPDDIALILHSSGTTGAPKRIPRLHRNIIANCHAVTRARAASASDRCLSVAPATHSQGFNLLAFTIFTGASLARAPGADLRALPGLVRAYQPTYLSTTPAVLRLLRGEHAALREAIAHSPLTRIHSSAGPLSASDLDQLEAALGVPILNGYGMSEVSGIAGEPYPRLKRVPGAVGPPWCEVTLRDEDGAVLGAGAIGEIAVRGATLFPGYLDDPAANEAAFLADGWFRTGDLGFLDDAGYLHLSGRRGEVINRGGEKIVPREVEDELLAHPMVAEAAVFGVPDARLGEDVVAAVVLKPGAQVKSWELRDWLLDRLAAHKVPRRIAFLDQFPYTNTGKVQRGELARRWKVNHH
jgi:acyl-CoA synthetase (AMP-forming)/AMP-acid ligase II